MPLSSNDRGSPHRGAASEKRSITLVSQSLNNGVGTWSLLSVTNTHPDGTVTYPVGERATGILMFDAAGNFSWQVIDPSIPRFVSNNRLAGTHEEYRAAVHGVMSHFETYAVDPSGTPLTLDFVSSCWPHIPGPDISAPSSCRATSLPLPIRPVRPPAGRPTRGGSV